MEPVLTFLGACAGHVLFFLLSLVLAVAVLGVLLLTGALLVEGSRRGSNRLTVAALPVTGLLRRRGRPESRDGTRFQVACFVLTLTVLINWMLHGPVPSVLLGVLALGVARLVL